MSKQDKQDGILPPRDQKRIDQDPERRGKSKKNTRRWCKGVVGRKHQPLVLFNGYWGDRQCGPYDWLPSRWSCHHMIACGQCGKQIKFSLGKDCPTRKASA